jgi:hypothetical protein
MSSAYEEALRELQLKDRSDPITKLIAKKIIEIIRSGERNPSRISAATIKALGGNPKKATN